MYNNIIPVQLVVFVTDCEHELTCDDVAASVAVCAVEQVECTSIIVNYIRM